VKYVISTYNQPMPWHAETESYITQLEVPDSAFVTTADFNEGPIDFKGDREPSTMRITVIIPFPEGEADDAPQIIEAG
jgi:hypothetical protein